MIAAPKHGRPTAAHAPGTRRLRPRGRGQSLVEFAIVLPVLLLVLSGILDFGFMLYSRMTIINATREGARAAVTAADDFTTVPGLVQTAVQRAAAGTGLVWTDVQVPAANITCVPAAGDPPCDFSTKTSAKPGDSVRVTVGYTYHTFFPLFFGQTMDLSSTIQMVIE